jgi:hypothetical protein
MLPRHPPYEPHQDVPSPRFDCHPRMPLTPAMDETHAPFGLDGTSGDGFKDGPPPGEGVRIREKKVDGKCLAVCVHAQLPLPLRGGRIRAGRGGRVMGGRVMAGRGGRVMGVTISC